MTRVVDKKATKIARARHERGVELLQAIFGFDPAEAERQRIARRDELATGPTADGGRYATVVGQHPTRHHWSRKGRRQVGKAQRLARRRNRA